MKTLVSLIAAAVLVVPVAAAATPKPAQQLTSYLKAIQKPASAMAAANNKADTADFFYNQAIQEVATQPDQAQTDWESFGQVLQKAHDLGAAAPAALVKVKAPAAMRGPHALFASAAAAFETKMQTLASKAGTVDPTSGTGFIDVGFAAEKARDTLSKAEVNWRQELTVQLRAAHITVPLWVKQVGVV